MASDRPLVGQLEAFAPTALERRVDVISDGVYHAIDPDGIVLRTGAMIAAGAVRRRRTVGFILPSPQPDPFELIHLPARVPRLQAMNLVSFNLVLC